MQKIYSMKKISIWANHHKWSARILIVLSFALLNVAAIVTGIMLDDLNVTIPAAVLTLSFLIYFAGIIFYPSKNVGFHPTLKNFFQQ